MVPVDVVSAILIELPVKSLLRFKCVSKEWYSLISDPYFIHLHLHRSIKTNRHDLRLILRERYSGTCKLWSLNSDSVKLHNPRQLINPLKRHQEDESYGLFKVLSSCNGLVCIMNETSSKIALWNISTGDYRSLPYVPMELRVAEDASHGFMYGLGHDTINDDYKLVRVARVKVGPTEHQIIGKTIVYSLRTNTWRRGEEIPYRLPYLRRPSTFVCGALHWVAVDDTTWPIISSAIIIAFDVGTEKYRQLELLDNMRRKHLVLGALGGCLCATENMSHRVNIWSMKDYGVKDSWTRLFSFGTDNIHALMPLAYSKTRDKLLAEAYTKTYSQTLIWYDLKDKEIKYVDRLKNIRVDSIEICMESLLQL